jgi:hypothetical protein
MARAAARAGRRAEEITLVAIAKTFPAEAIRAAHAARVRHFGENRVQEWESKRARVADLDATWHLVGHLQSNKARRAARLFHCVDSLDSLELAQKLDKATGEIQNTKLETRNSKLDTDLRTQNSELRTKTNAEAPRTQRSAEKSEVRTRAKTNTEDTETQRARRRPDGRLSVLIEVRLAAEETKSGVTEDELPRLVEGVLALPHLDLRGLMCIPPFFEDAEKVRPYFRRLRELRDDLRSRFSSNFQPPTSNFLSVLSMGMSHDFEVAIEEGATQVRLGTAIFGERK